MSEFKNRLKATIQNIKYELHTDNKLEIYKHLILKLEEKLLYTYVFEYRQIIIDKIENIKNKIKILESK